jgi:hypothetical protein
MMDVESCQRSVGTRMVLNDDWLPKQRTELVADDSADRVTGAAGAEDRHNRDRSRWVIFGVKRRAKQSDCGGYENESKSFHGLASRIIAAAVSSSPFTVHRSANWTSFMLPQHAHSDVRRNADARDRLTDAFLF